MKKLIYSFFAFFLVSVLYSQQISGNVRGSDGLPLPGVNVVSDSKVESVTDFDGNFIINVPERATLTFSMLGFKTKTIAATLGMRIVLEEEINALTEVVVIGYGTKKAGSITGSISQIKTENILRTPAQSAVQAIQGKAAGVNIVTNDEPGATPSIRIRGLGTILGGRNPLYVIDGVEAGGINSLSPNDIATIDILKDASSLAIYGQKGANGVVIITTKKGKAGEMKVSFNSYYGQKEILKEVKMADSYRYAYYSNSALGSANYFNFNPPYNTNWLDEITRKGEVTSNAVSISGGSENSNLYLGITHYTEKGILLGTDFKRTNILNKNEYRIMGDKLKINHFVNIGIVNNTPKPLSAFTNAYKQAPIMPVKYANGRWGAPFLNKETGINDLSGTQYDNYNKVANPVAQLSNINEVNKGVTLTGSLSALLKLHKNFTFTSSFGATADWSRGYTFTDLRENYLTLDPFSTDASYNATFGLKPILENKLEQRRYESYNWNWDNYVTYKKELEKHSFSMVAGMSRTTTNNSTFMNASRFNVPAQSNYWSLNFSTLNTADNGPLSVVQNETETLRVSLAYFGRLEYSFMDKYLFSAVVRREGISVFQGDKQWGTFPSVSAGWVISNEEFMKSATFINNLKIRGGYGEVGNGNGPTYNNIAFTSNKNYTFGSIKPTIYSGSNVANAVDPNLTWETMKEIDLGLDFTVMKNRLSGSVDFYNRKTDNIILPVSPPYVLSEEEAFLNSGEITNKGIEAVLRWEDNINDNIKYSVAANFSNNKNEVSRIDSPYFRNFPLSGSLGNGETTKRVFLGDPLGSFYVYEQIGYDSGGVPLYNDMVDGVAGLTDKDRINAGSYIPTYTYGLNLAVSYKNIDLSVDTYGVGGNKVYNGKKAQRQGNENIEYDILDSFWTPSTPNAANPKPFNDRPKPSTYYVEDGDYFRINNITLGYTIPKLTEKIDKVRLYVTAVNPFIFTNYSGYSPEVVGGDDANPLGTAGIEIDAYPTNRTFLVGVNVNF